MDYANDHHPILSGGPNGFVKNIHNQKYNAHSDDEYLTDGPHDDHPHEQETDTETLHEDDVHGAAAAQAAPKRLSLRARIVTIPKRIPPALPPRNPNRGRPSSGDIENGDLERLGNDAASSISDYEDKETGREILLASPVPSDRRDLDGFDDVALDASDGLAQTTSEADAKCLPSHDTSVYDEVIEDVNIHTHDHDQDHDHDYTKLPPLKPTNTETNHDPNPNPNPDPDPDPTTAPQPPLNPINPDPKDHGQENSTANEDSHSVPNTPSEVVRSGGGIPGAW